MEDMDMRSDLDLTPHRQSWIGFDHLFDMLEDAARHGQTDSFPPFDVEQNGEDAYRIRVAVAGFARDDIEITTEPNLLVISGRRQDNGERRYLYHGIASRSFERRFQLGDYVIVTNARLNEGLLEIDLRREIPDTIKPRKIEIMTDAETQKLSRSLAQLRSRSGNSASKAEKTEKSKGLEARAKPVAEAKRRQPALNGAW
jgi:molecular chaperone IbpA